MSLALFRQLDDSDGIASSLNSLGLVDWYTGNYVSARAIHRGRRNLEAIDDSREWPPPSTISGWLAAKEGHYQQARNTTKKH